jgi:hypothetical protein
MIKLLLAVATLSLVSCIPVEDFGTYWDKTELDKRLAGEWKWVAATPDQTLDESLPLLGERTRIAEKGGLYEVTPYSSALQLGNVPLFVTRTLSVGRYQFLAVHLSSGGFIQRYKTNGRVLELCQENIDEFVQTNYPHVANLENPGDVGDSMRIALFDSEVFAILSKVPDIKDYWYCEEKYERVP